MTDDAADLVCGALQLWSVSKRIFGASFRSPRIITADDFLPRLRCGCLNIVLRLDDGLGETLIVPVAGEGGGHGLFHERKLEMADVERAIAKDVMAASLRILVLAGSAVILASCYAVTETDVPHGVGRDLVGHPVAVVPAGKNRSDPAVVTSRGVLAYDRDLRACKQSALASVGPDRSADDAAAILRTIRDKPLGGSVAVRYESDDVATQRDAVVKRCLSRRGYLVEN